MQLKPQTEAALDRWLVPTWDSGRPYDSERFYKFVDQYQKDHGFSIDDADMREQIKRRAIAKGRPYGSHQETVVYEAVSLAYKILDFLKATGR